MIANPNVPAAAEKPAMGGAARAKLRADLDGLIRGWPARDALGEPIAVIAVHELVGAVRRVDGMAAVDVAEVTAALRGMGYDVGA